MAHCTEDVCLFLQCHMCTTAYLDSFVFFYCPFLAGVPMTPFDVFYCLKTFDATVHRIFFRNDFEETALRFQYEAFYNR